MIRDWFKLIGGAAVVVVTLGVLWVIASPLFVASKYVGRTVQKFDTETSAQVYDTSRQYQQGTNRDLARYCREWRESATNSGKTAVADLIRSTADTYQGPLTPENQRCLAEIK